jgi:hypothetical protein
MFVSFNSHDDNFEDVFSDVAPNNLVEIDRHFTGTYSLRHQFCENTAASQNTVIFS